LWPRILQIQLDRFVEYWNNHKIRSQKDKPNMSGSTPRHAFTVPAAPAQESGIAIDQVVIDMLCAQILVSHAKVMCWVDDSFDIVARVAYDSIGSPPLDNVQSGWDVFSSMATSMIASNTST